MRRALLWRGVIVGAVALLGLIAIAQAQRAGSSPVSAQTPAAESSPAEVEDHAAPAVAPLSAAPDPFGPSTVPSSVSSQRRRAPTAPATTLPGSERYVPAAEGGRMPVRAVRSVAAAVPTPADPLPAVAEAVEASAPAPFAFDPAAEPVAGPASRVAPVPAGNRYPVTTQSEPTPAAEPTPAELPNESPAVPADTYRYGQPATGGRYAAQPAPAATGNEIPPAQADPFNDMPAVPATMARQPAAADPFANPADPAAATTAPAGGNAFEEALPTTGGAATRNVSSEGTGTPGHKELDGPQTGHLLLEKRWPAEMQVGKAATVEIVVHNGSDRAAQGVEVRDEIPRGARLIEATPAATRDSRGGLLWKLGTLQPQEELILRVQLIPLTEGEIGSVASITSRVEASGRSLVTRPQLALQVTCPRTVLIDEDVPIKIRLTNSGTGIATGVVIRDMIPNGLRHPAGDELEYEIGELKPGETRDLDLALRAVQAGKLINELRAIGEGDLQAPPVKSEIEILAPALQVAADGPKKRFLERQAIYTFSVSNPGTAPAEQVALTATLPEGMEFVKADQAGQYDPATRTVRWLLEELPPQRTGSVTLATLPVQTGEQIVHIEAAADRGLSAKQQQQTVVEGVAAVLFQVVDVEDPIEVNGETTYEIRITNQGSKTATNVRVAAELPAQMKLLEATGETRHTIQGNVVQFETIPRLAPKADTTYRLRAKGLTAGDMRCRVQLFTDEMNAPVTKEESTRVYADE